MIKYGTPDELDSFIWLVPVLINYFIDTPIINKVRKMTPYHQHIITLLIVLTSLGAVLVGISGKMQSRILWCSIGWILMDVCLSLLEKLIQAEDSLGGAISGYVSAIAFTNVFAYRSLKKVIKISAWCYYAVAGLGAVCLMFKPTATLSIGSPPSKFNSWERLSTNFLTHCVNIYAVVWCMETFKRHGAYWGVQYGAAMLLALLLLRKITNLQHYYIYVQISLLLSCLSFFIHWNLLTLGIMVLLVGLTQETKGEEDWSQINVGRLELFGSILVLSVMPTVELLLLKRDDVFTSVMWMAGCTVLTLTQKTFRGAFGGKTMEKIKVG